MHNQCLKDLDKNEIFKFFTCQNILNFAHTGSDFDILHTTGEGCIICWPQKFHPRGSSTMRKINNSSKLFVKKMNNYPSKLFDE